MLWIGISGGLVILLHHAGWHNYMQRMIAEEAKLGNVVSTKQNWIVAQEELNACGDWSNKNDSKLETPKAELSMSDC